MHLRSRRPSLALGSLAVLTAVSLSACGDDSDGSGSASEDSGEPTSAADMQAPADWPNTVTLSGSPPNRAMFALTQRSAEIGRAHV